MYKLFEDWMADQPDPAVEKIVSQFEDWAKSLNLEHDVSRYSKDIVCSVRMMGYWTLAYEKSKTKGRQDSMYRQTYETKDSYKWVITFPGRTSQYDYRANTKPGNLKTFKGLIEKFMNVKEKFDLVCKFLELLDHEKFAEICKSPNINYSGKNLKDLECGFSLPGGTIYDNTYPKKESTAHLWRARYRTLDRNNNANGSQIDLENFDPETGALFYYALLTTRTEKEPEYDEDLLTALEIAKDQPLEKVWEQLKTGGLESLKKKYSGAVAGKQYGV